MDNAINSIILDKNEFTIEDAKEAAKQIFETQADDFYEIKEEKWYKRLLNAITLGAGRKKKVIKDIRSLSKLQTIFMHVYSEHYKDVDAQLNALIDNLSQTNIVVKKLYETCVLGIKPQAGIEQMPMLDREVLLLTVANYKSVNDKENELKKYRASVAKVAGINMPEGQFNTELLEKVEKVDVFYRCMAEMKAIDESECMPETIAVALENLNISNNAKKKIDELVSTEAGSFGTEYIVNKYSDGEEDIWGDVELTVQEEEQEQIFEEEILDVDQSPEDMRSVNEYEDEIISHMLFIKKGEKKQFRNKNIHIQKFIKCEGTLEIVNCVLYYNESDYSDEITLESGEANLYIKNSTIICKGWDEKPFITTKGEACNSIVFENNTFIDCIYFFDGYANNLKVNKCKMENCGINFIKARASDETVYDISENIFIKNQIRFSELAKLSAYTSKIVIDIRKGYRGAKSEIVFRDNTIIEEESYRKERDNICGEQFGLYDAKFLHCDGGVISNCTFIGISEKIGAGEIRECKFEKCTGGITDEVCDCKIVDNCVFEECTNVIRASDNMKITNCQFVSCYDNFICPNRSGGGISIEFCEFLNTKNGLQGHTLGSFFGQAYLKIPACIAFARSDDKNARANYLTKCIFDGVELADNFLIAAGETTKEPKGVVTIINECDFRNCSTKRNSGKIVKEYIQCDALFGKQKDFQANVFQNCRGLDKINKEGHASDNAEIKTISTTGNAIGSKIMQGVAKGMAINVLGILGGPVAMGIGAVAMGAYEKMRKK